jgi:predicted N-formylglutamate amidohydrolase
MRGIVGSSDPVSMNLSAPPDDTNPAPKTIAMTRTALFPPFEVIEGDRNKGLVLVSDHAFNLLPDEYGDLGLPSAEFNRHIAYDIGVESVTRKLAELTNAPAVMARFSRLLIDPNRGEDDPTLIRQLYDGTVIPGNYPLPDAERQRRIERFYAPYHDAVSSVIASVARKTGAAPLVISVHSFTPFMQGRERPWHAGVLWDKDPRAVRPLIKSLERSPGIIIGDNEPYDGALRGDTMFKHCTLNGYAHALIEIRQDLIVAEAGAFEWAARLAPILEDINRLPDIHKVMEFGSRTGPT